MDNQVPTPATRRLAGAYADAATILASANDALHQSKHIRGRYYYQPLENWQDRTQRRLGSLAAPYLCVSQLLQNRRYV